VITILCNRCRVAIEPREATRLTSDAGPLAASFNEQGPVHVCPACGLDLLGWLDSRPTDPTPDRKPIRRR
jgi:hypothetical protein